MSNRILSAVWRLGLPTHTQKLVLASLADQADDAGECWPSIDQLSERCCLSRQSVMDQLEKLKSGGHLKITYGGGRHANRYVVLVNTIDQDTIQHLVNTIDQNNKALVQAVDQKCGSVVVNAVDPSSQPLLPQQSTADTVAVNAVDLILKEPSLIHKKEDKPSSLMVEVFNGWNERADNVKLPRCLVLSDKRRQALSARLREIFFLGNWRKALDKICSSEFCKGVNERGWMASFDWFITRDAVIKTMEGKYDARISSKQGYDWRKDPNHKPW